MASLNLHKTQHYSVFIALIFLLQSLFPSLGYTRPDKYFINCGSENDVNENSQVYIGESNTNYPKHSFRSSTIESSHSTVSSPLYQTARIFREQSWYEFNTDSETKGTYLVRLHFFPFSSQTNLSSASFNVSVTNGFWLLSNFNDSVSNNSSLVKEFFMRITLSKVRITFTPLTSSFAFVNAIELFVLPLNLINDDVLRFTYGFSHDLSTFNGGLFSHTLETKHRVNVGGGNVSRNEDDLLRNWIPDDSFLINPADAYNYSYNAMISYQVDEDDSSDGPNSNAFTAPNVVYQTAKMINNSEYITWSLPVDKNADQLLRLHFCDLWNPHGGMKNFILLIYDNYVMDVNNDGDVNNELPAPYYYDFVVQSDDSGFMKISVMVNINYEFPIQNAFLNGLEIMKLIDSSSSVPLDLDEPKHSTFPVVLGSTLGGLVLVSSVAAVFVWYFKFRKERPVENSNGLPIPNTAGGSLHRSTHGSLLSNINLSLKISLLDLQLTTENFDTKHMIGKGGFGNVYKGVLKNGIRVAVKRSESGTGSGQGLTEFQTEIKILSKIRHKHLVSLIGYCDEGNEMILVYEYMEKGTLRDHLYDTNSPSLSWKQRLEICIGAARGLHYLHKGSARGIIHRDVKSTNILLDENHMAKVADFGLSRTGPLDHQSYVSTCVKGTFGYLDPDYFRSQQLTEKSDVYSFGVVLLEVLCARPAIDLSLPRLQVNLAEWGMLCKNMGKLEEIVDPSIKGQIDQNSLRKFSETVEKSLQEYGSDRPTMGDVLWDLEFALQFQIGATHRQQHEDSSSSASSSLQLPNVRRIPSLSTLNEMNDFSIVRG